VRVRAALLPETGAALELTEVELAPPDVGEVLVRLHASGVCHSDLNAIDGTAATRCPAVLGHEGAGVVEAVGPGVGLPVGAHVALSWMPSCGACEECLRELPHLCRTVWSAMGHGGLLDGTPRLARNGRPVYHYSLLSTFAERAVVPARCCIPIPEDVPFDVAGLVGCAITTGTGAVWNTASVRPGDRVCVIGCGGVGLSAVLGAVAAGAEPVVAVDLSEAKLATAIELGATSGIAWAGTPEETAEGIREATGGGVDVAVEATGRPEAARAAFLATRARGAAVLVGIPRADAEVSLPALSIPRLERRILGSIYGSSRPERDFPRILELYRSGRLPLDRLVSHRLPLDEVAEAFRLMGSGDAIRVVLDLHATSRPEGGSAMHQEPAGGRRSRNGGG
jgi:Zn-dependent alcohol dehydrogenase